MTPSMVAGVPMTGRRVRLERLQPRHVPSIYAIASAETTAAIWPLLGHDVEREEFGDYLWQLAPVQFALVRRDSGAPIGVVQALDIDQRSGTVGGVGLIIDPDLWRAGWPFEGVVLFLDYLFTGAGYRKAYFTMPTSVLDSTGGALNTYLTTECVVPSHVRNGDEYEDMHILSIHMRDWDSALARRITGNASLG